MTKKPVHKIIAFITAVCTLVVMCGLPAVAFAWEGGITKEETVYVVTDSSGTQGDVIVSDHLVNKNKAETISDETTLSDIENVKGEETFKQKGDALTWDAEGNSIYYQGKTDAEVPVTMDIVYRLNDKVVSGSELQGQSGKVEIKINYENNAEYQGTTVPFVVMTGLIITDDSFKNIKISKGKVIDDGEKLLVVGMAAPGLAQTLGVGESELGFGSTVTITGDADKFAVEDMMTVVTNAFFEDIDTGSLGDLDYDDEIDALNKGSKALVDGSDQLYEGLDMMSDKMPTLQSGVKQLKDGSESLQTGSHGLHEGLGQVKAGVDKAKDGASKLKGEEGEEGMGKAAGNLSNAAAMDDNAIKDIAKVEGEINAIETELDAYLDSRSVSDEVKVKIQALKDRLDGIKDTLGNPQKHDFNPYSENLKTTEKLMVSSSTDSGVATSMTTKGTSEAPTLYDGVSGLESGLATLSASLGNDKAPGTVINGSAQVEGGAKSLADGLTMLYGNTDTMVNGVYQLGNGAYKLRQGMSKLYNEGIKKIVDLYKNDLKGTLDNANSMLDAGKGYKTFTKLPSGMDGNVKFIYKTDITN